jgi:hypothetical protein
MTNNRLPGAAPTHAMTGRPLEMLTHPTAAPPTGQCSSPDLASRLNKCDSVALLGFLS